MIFGLAFMRKVSLTVSKTVYIALLLMKKSMRFFIILTLFLANQAFRPMIQKQQSDSGDISSFESQKSLEVSCSFFRSMGDGILRKSRIFLQIWFKNCPKNGKVSSQYISSKIQEELILLQETRYVFMEKLRLKKNFSD